MDGEHTAVMPVRSLTEHERLTLDGIARAGSLMTAAVTELCEGSDAEATAMLANAAQVLVYVVSLRRRA